MTSNQWVHEELRIFKNTFAHIILIDADSAFEPPRNGSISEDEGGATIGKALDLQF